MIMNELGANVCDVKKLIKEHVKVNTVTRDIDSPYAKYNSRGQLMCVVCGTPVKSKIIWQAHINKRSHKENLTKLKEKQEQISSLQYKNSQKAEKKIAQKRPASPSKTLKPTNKKVAIEKPKGILKNVSTYSSSEEETDNDIDEPRLQPIIAPIKSELPSDFFDPSISNDGNLAQQTTENKNPNKEDLKSLSKTAASDALPEGFFDDPVADAKARNVEYKDKEAEEWLTFMKEVSAAEVESQQIIAEDKEEAALETQMEQTNEQIKCLERIVELDKAKQSQLQEKKNNAVQRGSDDSSDEEFSPVIWRTKNSLI